jgi:4'-phosphopantetheinyl transferase EntD
VDKLAPFFFVCEQSEKFSSDNDVFLVRCQYDSQYYQQALFTELDVYCPNNILSSVVKRQAEYLAGRYCAQSALHHTMGENHTVTTGDKRQPIWPKGIVGAISHTHSSAVCIVSDSRNIKGLGVDQEFVLTAKVITEISQQIVNNAEAKLLDSSNIAYDIAFTIAFSAKESFFKAMFPLFGDYFDFKAVTLIHLLNENNSGEFILILNQYFNSDFQLGQQVRGFFSWQDNVVETSVLLS